MPSAKLVKKSKGKGKKGRNPSDNVENLDLNVNRFFREDEDDEEEAEEAEEAEAKTHKSAVPSLRHSLVAPQNAGSDAEDDSDSDEEIGAPSAARRTQRTKASVAFILSVYATTVVSRCCTTTTAE